jgi:hypothetical protein
MAKTIVVTKTITSTNNVHTMRVVKVPLEWKHQCLYQGCKTRGPRAA